MLGNQSTGARSLECETFHWEGGDRNRPETIQIHGGSVGCHHDSRRGVSFAVRISGCKRATTFYISRFRRA